MMLKEKEDKKNKDKDKSHPPTSSARQNNYPITPKNFIIGQNEEAPFVIGLRTEDRQENRRKTED